MLIKLRSNVDTRDVAAEFEEMLTSRKLFQSSLNLNCILQRNFKSQDINICGNRVIIYTCDVLKSFYNFRSSCKIALAYAM